MYQQRCARNPAVIKADQVLVNGLTRLFSHQLKLVQAIDSKKGTNLKEILKAGVRSKAFQTTLEHLIACLSNELEECRDWTSWKPWKTYPKGYNRKNLTELQFEVIDLLHFWLELAALVGLDGKSAARLYLNKHDQNLSRQQNGY